MKQMKKLLAIILVIALSISMIPATNVYAAKKVKLNKKKVTLYVGKTVTLKLQNNKKKVKWSSSNKKVATVSKKGKVKAKKKGKATITAKVGKKKYKCKVTVKKKVATKPTVQPTTKPVTSAQPTTKPQQSTKPSELATAQILIPTEVVGACIVKQNMAEVSFMWSQNVTQMNAGQSYRVYIDGTYYNQYPLPTTVTYKFATVGKHTIRISGVLNGLETTGVVLTVDVLELGSSTESTTTGNPTIEETTTEQETTEKSYQLVWSDEFNENFLNMNNWTYEEGNGIDGWGNQELQNYTAGENIKFENGSLVIVPRMEWNTETNKVQNVTSTRLNSKNKKAFKYGKIEIRAKATKATGTWSSGWMLGTNGQTWPFCGEIDIIESLAESVVQTIHCPYFNNMPIAPGGNKIYAADLTQDESAEQYHTYGIIWDDTKIHFIIDGKLNGTYNPSLYSQTVIPLSQTWECFQNPFYFIFNCAVGGNAAGEVSTDGWTLKSTEGNIKTYEDYYYIDYVRVYQ